MNPNLDKLQPYPFQRLASLFEGVRPDATRPLINLQIGEPKHPTPAFIRETLAANLDGLAIYPATRGSDALRGAIAAWLGRRHGIDAIDPATEVLPVTGSREALFALAHAVIDASRPGAVVVSPNPFYQIYEGATLLAGAEPRFLNQIPGVSYAASLAQLPDDVWRRTQLVYACSPHNPTGAVMSLEDWRALFELSDRHGFIVAADECYSEIYFDDAAPPLGALAAARRLGRTGYPRLVVLGSLSKRSSVPGMRSGFVAGNAALLSQFLLYRTYHGCAMSSVVAAASIAAWNDEDHVVANRAMYREKFDAVLPVLAEALDVERPDAAFYLWPRTPVPDTEFTRRLYAERNVMVLPGSFLARDANGGNPGAGRIRIALVAPTAECLEAARRIRDFARSL